MGYDDHMAPEPVSAFEAHRGLLHAIAYRMLGSVADAEDVLQEARIRWLAAPHAEIATPRAYLVTVVSRLCLDVLGSARARREAYVGEWLPEPIATTPTVDPGSVSIAFMVLLERLSPSERAAFLLADVFDYSFAEVAAVLGKSEDACRQLAATSRRLDHAPWRARITLARSRRSSPRAAAAISGRSSGCSRPMSSRTATPADARARRGTRCGAPSGSRGS